MSKFIEELEKVGVTTPPRLGFGTGKTETKSLNLLIVGLIDSYQPKKHSNSPITYMALASQSIDSITLADDKTVVGTWPANTDSLDLDSLSSSSGDFIIIPDIEARSEIMAVEDIGKLIVVTDSTPEEIYRSIEELPIDGIVVSGMTHGTTLSIRDIMWMRSIRDVSTKPILLSSSRSLSYQELSLIRDAGLQGIILDLKKVKDKDVKDMLTSIDSIPSRKSSRESISATLPRIQSTSSEPDHDFDDEEFD